MLEIYAMEISAPALKVLYTANYLGLKYEQKKLNMQAGEHKKEEYLKIHPAGKVPAINDDGFIVFESNAIMRYLAQKENSDIYPADLKKRAIVDQWLDFASIHIQNGVGRVFWNKMIAPKVGGEVDEASMKCGYEFLERFLPVVDAQLGASQYYAGDQITIADFTLLAHTDPLQAIEIDVSKYPNLAKWREDLTQQDFYQKVHKFFGESMMAQQ